MENIGENINAILKGRETFKAQMEYLFQIPVDRRNAYLATMGYFVLTQKSEELATRTINAVEEIEALFVSGKGNHGRNAYDLVNGATDYWTNGNGAGNEKRTDKATRVYKANYAAASDHKVRFAEMLLETDSRGNNIGLGKMVEAGRTGKKKEKETVGAN
jgi:hypothetical protein